MGVPWLTRHSFFSFYFDGFMDKNSVEVVLIDLIAKAQITGWQELSDQAGISIKRLRKLRRGQSDHLKLSELVQLSRSLQISLGDLLGHLGISVSPEPSKSTAPSLEEFQLACIKTIESFLIYWPAAAHQVQKKPDFPASKLLPLVKPIERLLANWGVTPIDQVGAVLPFHPQQHQAIDGQIATGEMVIVRYPGYQQGNKLLWRSQVSRS
jgi:DNA-binding Xre family transcriptional regulator